MAMAIAMATAMRLADNKEGMGEGCKGNGDGDEGGGQRREQGRQGDGNGDKDCRLLRIQVL
jgi:hypothetical protein